MRSNFADANEIMSDSDFETVQPNDILSDHGTSEFDDIPIKCVDVPRCSTCPVAEREF